MTDSRVSSLELKLRHTQGAVILLSLVLLTVVAGHWQGVAIAALPAPHDEVLHVRGIVIEDSEGRPRLLLGAPTPTVAARKRTESLNGLVLLGENGADRIVISYPGYEPQVLGRVAHRTVAVPSAGLMLNDAEGNERAGIGVSDDGTRVSLGFDYADRDALGLLVSPTFSGLAIFARDGERNDQIIAGINKSGTATLKLADNVGDENIIMEAHRPGGLKLQTLDPSTHKLVDVSPKLAQP